MLSVDQYNDPLRTFSRTKSKYCAELVVVDYAYLNFTYFSSVYLFDSPGLSPLVRLLHLGRSKAILQYYILLLNQGHDPA